MGNHKKLILFGVGIAVGTIILVVAIIIGTLLPQLAQDQIEDALVVDKAEPNDKSFQHWVSNNYSEAAPYYKVFTFLNLTNYYDVQSSGAKPIYQSVGPYYYRRYTTKLNYTFTEDGDKVAYSTYQPLYYEPDLGNSSLNPYSDVIYSINPTYVGLIVAARGESNLVQGMVAPTWKTVMSSVNSEAGYVGLVIDQYFIPYLLQNQQSLVAELGGDQAALEQFLSIWANDTTDPVSPSGFNSTMRISVGGTSSGISLNSASLLFDMSQTLSLVSTNPYGFQTWFAAEQGDPTSIGGLQATFGLTSQQLNMILAWRGRFKPTYYNSLSAAFGIANVTDLGYYQWGMGNLTAVDIATYMQAFAALPETPEFAIWAQNIPGDPVFSVDQSKQILAGEYSMLNTTNYITFITLLSQNNYGVITARWGLTPTQAQYLYGYISAVIKDVYVVEATLQPAFAAGGGLIAYHTVDEWLWTCVDPLLEILLPSSPYCNLFTNDTSEAEELATAKASTYWTGKSDINKIVEFIDYEGDTTVDIWESPQPVGGTDASQFAPGVKKSDVLKAFVSDLARIVDLTFEKTVKVKGISLYRYVLADYMMDVDPVFYQSIPGFANMSSDNSGTPIFLSKPNFLDCDPYWQNQMEGVVPDSSYDTVIEVEPITGVTMNAHKQLQLNVYYENTTSWTSLFSVFNPNMTSGLFYPVVWVDETSVLTDKQADDFKTAVLEPLRAFRITLIVGTIVGGLMAIAFAGVMIYFVKNQSSSHNVDVIDLAEPM